MKDFDKSELFPNRKPTRISVYDYDEYNHYSKHSENYQYVAMFDNAAVISGHLLLVKNEKYPKGFLTVNNNACGHDSPYDDKPPLYLVRLPFTFNDFDSERKLATEKAKIDKLDKEILDEKICHLVN